METKIEDLVKPIFDLHTAIQNANVTLAASAAIMRNQAKMLDIALEELISLAQTDAIPLFFRKEIFGSLQRIKEIGLPK